MAALAPPVQVVESGAPPFVHVPSGAPPFVVVSGNAPPITIVESGAPPITLFNEDGSIWSAHTPAGGEVLLTGETDGFATDFLHPVDAERVAVKTAGTVVSSGTSFFTSSGTSSKWVYNAAGTLVNIPVGTLPLDYDPVTHAARGLLVEPAATNLVKDSADFTTGNWTVTAINKTANAAVAPDGTTTADKITETAVPSTFDIQQTVPATTGTWSVFVKAAERSNVMLYDLTAAKGNGFNLSAGTTFTVGGITTTGGAAIQSVGNGWYRCSIPVTSTTSPRVYLHNGTTYSYTGTAGFGAYLWGAQLETGSVATSYIPTTSATVTRAGDQIKVTPAAINHSATAGSWWIDTTIYTSAAARIIAYTTGLYGPIGIASPTIFQLYDGGAVNKTVGSVIGSYKLAAAFASGDQALTLNGEAPGTAATAGTALGSPGAEIGIGFNPANTVAQVNAHIRQLYYLPRRMPNAEMVTETT